MDTHPKIYDVSSLEWEQEVQMLQQGIMRPSAQVVRANRGTGVRKGNSVFLCDGIVENFTPRRQRQQAGQRTQTAVTSSDKNVGHDRNKGSPEKDSASDAQDEKLAISRENNKLLQKMTLEQIWRMQEELEDVLTPEIIAWFKNNGKSK